MNAEGSLITSRDSGITSEGSALKNEDSVKESENLEGKTCLSHVWLIEVRSFFRFLNDIGTQSSLKKLPIYPVHP